MFSISAMVVLRMFNRDSDDMISLLLVVVGFVELLLELITIMSLLGVK